MPSKPRSSEDGSSVPRGSVNGDSTVINAVLYQSMIGEFSTSDHILFKSYNRLCSVSNNEVEFMVLQYYP